MQKELKYIAQAAMDLFYGGLRGDGFFTIEDFIIHTGNTLTDLYLQEFRIQYQQLRQEKRDEVVAFSAEWLATVIVDVKTVDGELVATMPKRIMSFPYDSQNTGLQEVIASVPRGTKLERSNITEEWEMDYLPETEKIFWRLERDKIYFYRNSNSNISKVKVLYVPSPDADSEIPDGVANYVITTTVTTMKQVMAGQIIDKSNDSNPNKVLQTEINR